MTRVLLHERALNKRLDATEDVLFAQPAKKGRDAGDDRSGERSRRAVREPHDARIQGCRIAEGNAALGGYCYRVRNAEK